MTRLSIGQKATKTGILLAGLRDARIAPYLRPYGLTDKDIQEGWDLFMKATGHRINRTTTSNRLPTIEKQLDEFENTWFPVVHLALARHFPSLDAHFFQNLERAEGRNVNWMVAFFLQRLEAMEKGEAPFGEEGPKAREFLRVRGLKDEHVDSAAKLVEELGVVEAAETAIVDDTEALHAAEDAMWQWYLEWSGLARRAIKDGNLLRLLGFRKRKGREAVEIEVIEETPNLPGDSKEHPVLPGRNPAAE